MKITNFILILLFSIGVMGEPYPYGGHFLSADKDFYSIVLGSGQESGFDFEFQARQLREDQINDVTVIITNDLDNCSLGEVNVLKKVHNQTSLNVPFYDVTFTARIYTSPTLSAESGGCLVQAKKSRDLQADVLKIVEYYYSTNK